MKVYLIIEVDSLGHEYITNKCFSSKEKAEKYCEYHDKDTYEYLQHCRETHEAPDYFSLFYVNEIEVIEDDN